MAQINFRIDDDIKVQAETLFSSLGMNTSTALMIFIRQSLTDRAIPFQIRQTPARPSSDELTRRIDDIEHGRNCHYHELIEASQPVRISRTRRAGHAKAMA